MALKISISGVRGLVPETLTPEVCLDFAKAFGTYLQEQQLELPRKIVIGTDPRASSEFIKGISCVKDPLSDLKNLLLSNLPKTIIKRAVLFGSIAEGAEKINSDIDIFFLVKDRKYKRKLELLLDKLSNICLEAYGNRLSPYILTEQEMKKKKSLKLISEINKGIQIFPVRKDKP